MKEDNTDSEENKTEKSAPMGTPYDDVFRTMITDSDRLTISMINEMFGKHIPDDAVLTRLQNEVFLASRKKRISDSDIRVDENEDRSIGEAVGEYHMECESLAGDNAILIRLFEYTAGKALNRATLEDNTLRVRFPRTGVLFLRDTKNTPDRMNMVVETSESGSSLTIEVPVMKVSRYSLEDIFEKKLWFLLPFYVFRYWRGLGSKNADCFRRTEDEIISSMRRIGKELESLALRGEIDTYNRYLLKSMISEVANAFARKSERVIKEVDDIMGGKVLNYEAKDILRKGQKLKLISLVRKKMAHGCDANEIAKDLIEEIGEVKDIMSAINECGPTADDSYVYELLHQREES